MSEDSSVVAASIVSGSTSASSIGSTTTDSKPLFSPSTNSVGKNTKPSLSTLINEHQGDSVSVGHGAGTLNSGSLRFEEDTVLKSSQTYGEELGSGVSQGSSPELLSPEATPSVPKKKLAQDELLTKQLQASAKTFPQSLGSSAKAKPQGKTASPSLAESRSHVTPKSTPVSFRDGSGSSSSSGNGSTAAASQQDGGRGQATITLRAKGEHESKSKRRKERKRGQAQKAREGMKDQQTQTWGCLTTDQWVMTDPIPPVESYKERYEEALREKSDLQVKLESSGDRMYKLQKEHRREVEKVQQQSRKEASEVRREVLNS